MSKEALEKIAAAEEKVRAGKAAAEAEGRKLVKDAERFGRALLQTVRDEAQETGRQMLEQAEKAGEAAAREILLEANKAGKALCRAAEQRLDAAAEQIVRGVVER